ncbi:hypothetical protein DFQ50_101543 [Pseudocitrobacter faecalis]|uniref:Uncharacterized protein n=1 Tax=Pseudocitrobacter faecalis TaxID=1398493 RepID=A0ABX9G3L0_9ENTR|nr:hypothetical protein DFQ50_101543 [Pseudocitrobacter faecalis]
MTPETDNASIKTLITKSLSRPFLLVAFTFKQINKQFREY